MGNLELYGVVCSLLFPSMAADKWPKKVTSGNVSVKVYQVKHKTASSGFAYVLAYSAGGKRRLSKFADPSAALAEARLTADQLNAGHIEGASMSSSDRAELQYAREIAGRTPLIAALEEWQSARKLCQGSIVQACEFWATIQRAKVEDVPVSEAAKRFLSAKRKAGVDTKAGLERTLPAFVDKFGTQSIASVSAKALQRWLDTMDNPSTRNTSRTRIVTFFRWARKVELLPSAARK